MSEATDIAVADDGASSAGRTADRVTSPALLVGLALMPLAIGAGLLRERLDAAADPELRPTLSFCLPAGDCATGGAPISLPTRVVAAQGGAGSSMVRAGRS